MSIELSYPDEFALLTIDRPEALNALSFSLIEDIGRAIDDVSASSARALIVTGAGERAFCAGADVGELMDQPAAERKSGLRLGQTTFAKLDSLEIPSVALVNGYAFGGGAELALACTFRLALPGARFALPEIKLGLIPGYGGTQRLPRLVGAARGLEIILTGRTVGAQEAVAIGLANRLVDPPGLDACIAFVREFSGYSLAAIGSAREAVRRAGETSLDEGLWTEAEIAARNFQSKDSEEGMRAFLEKRPPRFEDS